jgi:hypothetical protein
MARGTLSSPSKATTYRLMKADRFPKAVAGNCDEVNDWISFPAACLNPVDF